MKEVTEIRSGNRNKLRKSRRAAAAAAAGAATTTSNSDNSNDQSPPSGNSSDPSTHAPSATQNRFTALENASHGSMEIDSDGQASNNTPNLYE